MGLPRYLIEDLIYGTGDTPRFTQDSPVLPDVWFRFAERPDEAHDLLLTPHFDSNAGEVGAYLRKALPRERRLDARVAYTQSYVAARLHFDELVRHVLPETSWWQWNILAIDRPDERGRRIERRSLDLHQLAKPEVRDVVCGLLESFDPGDRLHRLSGRDEESEDALPTWTGRVPTDLLWLTRIVGAIAWAKEQVEDGADPEAELPPPDAGAMTAAIARLVSDLDQPGEDDDLEAWLATHKRVWLINLNREARTAVDRSVLAVKADAARNLFDIDCSHLAWAIVDNGIDARHPAFWRRSGAEDPRDDDDLSAWAEHTRVVATYDFTRIRDLLDPAHLETSGDGLPGRFAGLIDHEQGETEADLVEQLEELRTRLLRGRKLDWGLLEPFLRVPHDERYSEHLPTGEHGTHVAGILAADWPQHGMTGMCPDIRLYDLRVLGAGGANDEFAVLAALQFIDHLNAKKDFFAIHGVNVSLAIRHEVANFACGRTPVCDECERLVSSGVVVVAAAGNEGYLQYLTTSSRSAGNKPRRTDGYHTVSITDPGNADKVITVGATHRFQPHTYGVSYFSSRGPTGDGRIKPDLVAPGEKIQAPVPNAGWRRKDGTSMAAPHASGAAALLMARHGELIGQPQRIKQVLCDTATDLGRERYFQGAGMLDVLRALQAI